MAEFAAVVDEALAEGRASEQERMEWVHANSWAARHRTVLDILLDRDGARSEGAIAPGRMSDV